LSPPNTLKGGPREPVLKEHALERGKGKMDWFLRKLLGFKKGGPERGVHERNKRKDKMRQGALYREEDTIVRKKGELGNRYGKDVCWLKTSHRKKKELAK